MIQGDPQEETGVRAGQVLAGKYRGERVLGVGVMGAVVAAQHMQLDEKVAIKFLLPAMLRNQEVVMVMEFLEGGRGATHGLRYTRTP
jgi:serine/threonine protein kinase